MARAKNHNWNKLYQVWGRNYEEQQGKGTEFAHPEIRIGLAYGTTAKYWKQTAELTFQANLKDSDYLPAFRTYAGAMKARLEDLPEAAAIVRRATAKANQLAPAESCELTKMLIGLRAIGFREAHVRDSAVWSVT